MNQILRVPHDHVSSYEVIQPSLFFFWHYDELLSSPVDLDRFPGLQNTIEKPIKICPQPRRFYYHGRIVAPYDSYVKTYANTYVLSGQIPVRIEALAPVRPR